MKKNVTQRQGKKSTILKNTESSGSLPIALNLRAKFEFVTLMVRDARRLSCMTRVDLKSMEERLTCAERCLLGLLQQVRELQK